MKTHIVLETPVEDTPRVQQVRGMFDLAEERTARVELDVDLPIEEKPWNLGLIVGPSGSGKSTVARRVWPTEYGRTQSAFPWSRTKTVLDDFPTNLSIKEVVGLLCSVGFSSPPCWLRPYSVLSTGQQFRVSLARHLAEATEREECVTVSGQAKTRTPPSPIVLDEFTSTVDRTVAQIGSAAVAKAIRSRGLQFVAVTCHEDVEEWLQPDWEYRPAEQRFAWRTPFRRPGIRLELVRCAPTAWALFVPHHYLSETLCFSAVCFLACWQERPVCFSSWIRFVGNGPATMREHRTVTLPDYQGVGIGNAVSDTLASMWAGLGFRAASTTTHPAMIASRRRSPHWRVRREPSFAKKHTGPGRKGLKHANRRLTTGFVWIGPAMNRTEARMLRGG